MQRHPLFVCIRDEPCIRKPLPGYPVSAQSSAWSSVCWVHQSVQYDYWWKPSAQSGCWADLESWLCYLKFLTCRLPRPPPPKKDPLLEMKATGNLMELHGCLGEQRAAQTAQGPGVGSGPGPWSTCSQTTFLPKGGGSWGCRAVSVAGTRVLAVRNRTAWRGSRAISSFFSRVH